MKYRRLLDPHESWFPALVCFLCALILLWTLWGCSVNECRASFAVTTAADAGTTQAGINRGYTEANPVLRSNAVLGTLVASVALAAVAEWCLKNDHKTTGLLFYRIGAVLHGGAATSNAIQLRRK